MLHSSVIDDNIPESAQPPSSAGSSGAASDEEPRTDGADIRLLDHERLFVAAVESSIHAFITVDLSAAITSWSPGAERMFGYSAQEAVGASINLIVPPGEEMQLAVLRAKIRQGSRVETYEAVRIAKDGRKVNVVVTLSPIKAPSGAVIGVCSILSDVTDQRIVEKLFGLVVEACPSGMIVSNQDGNIVLVNSATERLFGYAREELVGQSIEVLVPERLRGAHAVLRREFAGRPECERAGHGRVMTACCRDGAEISVEIGLNPITIEGRRMVLSVVSDVSERQRVERMKNEFIAHVSHELRTPLTSITGSLGLLLGGAAGPQPEPVMRLLSIAHGNSQRLVRLINDLLDIEKIELGQVVYDFQVNDIRALVEQAIEANRGFSEPFRVQVRLAPDARSSNVSVDADRMIQVMTNLLSNACKFSPAGSDVEVRIDQNDAGIRVAVRDHGPGIPEEFKSRVFGKFAQADGSDARRKGGSGLGLNIVKQVVTQHGGKVGFEDAPGGGTIFYIDLPVVNDAAARGSKSADAAAQPRAMICSGDLDMSPALCALVRSRGFAADMLPTAHRALAQAALARYALFVIGLPVRDLDGVSLIRQLRESRHHAETPVVVIDVNAGTSNADLRYDELGIVGFVKPADHERLARILDRVKAGSGRPRILHVEDDLAMQELVARLSRREFDIIPAMSLDEARRALQSGEFDASLLDLSLPDGRGADLLPDLQDHAGKKIPVVVHSGYDADEQVGARADAVVMKAQTSINNLIGILRRIVGEGRSHERPESEVA